MPCQAHKICSSCGRVVDKLHDPWWSPDEPDGRPWTFGSCWFCRDGTIH